MPDSPPSGPADIATSEQKAAAVAWLMRIQTGGNVFEQAHATVLLDWIDAPPSPAPGQEPPQ
jgi:hypothetical protein